MLKLENITKNYKIGDSVVEALRGVDIEFRKSEFVSILGPSGCGKTTLLNIIGGLDRYTEGDLSINRRSTKDFKNRDWDTYRNHSVGFVFQSYNLISHQTVLANVELALTLNGVSKSERRKRAIDALTRVGLADQMKKKPNQMSGGQMQRVAIARALVNNPDILLADEPTGALDSHTSVQVMEILKEISADKLVIMVTHNPDLAEKYSSRIVNLFDGKVVGDSDPYVHVESEPETKPVKSKKSEKKPSMSFFTAASLSLNNLMTKKARTFLTSFAGSIGIIGIALIMSISNGFQAYINRVQEDTLSSYPLSITKESVDVSSLMMSIMDNALSEKEHSNDMIYTNNIMADMMNTLVSEVRLNNLEAFKDYIESEKTNIKDYVSDIQYSYNINPDIYIKDTSEGIYKVCPNPVMDQMTKTYRGGQTSSFGMNTASAFNAWQELINNKALLESQYDLLSGQWPENEGDVILMVDKNNEIVDVSLYSLGICNSDDYSGLLNSVINGETVESKQESFSYDEIVGRTFKLVLKADMYKKNEDTGLWVDMSEDEEFMKNAVNNGIDINICGIVRPNENAVTANNAGVMGYTHALIEKYISETSEREIVKEQLSNENRDIFTGLAFPDNSDDEITMEDVNDYLAILPEEEQAQMKAMLSAMTEEQILETFSKQLSEAKEGASLDKNLSVLGVADADRPVAINIYPKDFNSKDNIEVIISDYNKSVTEDGHEEKALQYTDFVGLMLSSVSTIVDVISYVLIAFVAVSLIVSSIMIGIITYISVLERTKEIGILRAIGASKRDISRVFNAETLIIGFASGAIGILLTLLLILPVNAIIESVAEITDVAALPTDGAIILVIISMFLTFIAGLIPSRIAARKDPVVALRTE